MAMYNMELLYFMWGADTMLSMSGHLQYHIWIIPVCYFQTYLAKLEYNSIVPYKIKKRIIYKVKLTVM